MADPRLIRTRDDYPVFVHHIDVLMDDAADIIYYGLRAVPRKLQSVHAGQILIFHKPPRSVVTF